MLNNQFQQLKDALSDPEFQKKMVQQVVKAVVVTTAIAVTSSILKYTERGIATAFENKKELLNDMLSPDLIDS